jgi:hypothetical protein
MTGDRFKAKARRDDRKSKPRKVEKKNTMIRKGSDTYDGTFLSPISANSWYVVATWRLITLHY